jgi:TRAP-type mannitol/chloroaromatic compound transport system permease small subunit
MATPVRRETVGVKIDRALQGAMPDNRQRLVAILCVIFAFVPGLMAVVYITLGVGVSNWQGFLIIGVPGLIWLGLTCYYYRHAKTKSAARLFALFPIAFAETVMYALLWLSSTHPAS